MPRIEFELIMKNDVSHFSQEEVGILPFNIIILLLFAFFLGKSIVEFYKDFKYEQTFENPIIIMIISISCDLLSLLCMVIHQSVYAYDGDGVFALEVFSRMYKMIGQVGIIWLLLMISFGWTITYRNVTDHDLYIA